MDIKKRLSSLQTGYPDDLVLLAKLPGDETIESEIHNLFGYCRLRGEWFSPDNELLKLIEKIKDERVKLSERMV